jgi:hypothetical protein
MIASLETYSIRDNFNLIRDIWIELSSQAEVSFFLSWGWIENWISSLPVEVKVFLVVGTEEKRPKAAFFVGIPPPSWRRFILIKKSLYLNSTGIPEFDSLFIEYNSILVAPGYKLSFREIIHLLPFEWEEFVLPGVDVTKFAANSIFYASSPYNVLVKTNPSFFVDLEKIRKNNDDYLSMISSNTRRQIRRAISLYKEKGQISICVATTLSQSIEIFDELVNIHQMSWKNRGMKGAFSSKYFLEFHKELIKKRFENGEIQLLKVKCGDETIGCLYNFIFNKIVYFYQSGFIYSADNKLKPGLITHVEAILYNAKGNNVRYDFLAGYSQYKKSLATDSNELLWIVVQKKMLKFKIENFSKKIWRKIFQHNKSNRHPLSLNGVKCE